MTDTINDISSVSRSILTVNLSPYVLYNLNILNCNQLFIAWFGGPLRQVHIAKHGEK